MCATCFVLTVKVLFNVLFFVLVEFSVIRVQESAPKEVCSRTALEERSCYPMCLVSHSDVEHVSVCLSVCISL